MNKPVWRNGIKILLVTASREGMASLPVRPMIDLLADRTATVLRDRVWTLRLTWGPCAPPPAEPGPNPPPARTLHLDRDADPQQQLHDFLVAFDRDFGLELDLLVLDPTELFAHGLAPVNRLIVAAMSGLEASVAVSYLVRDATEWHDAPFELGPTHDTELLPTVLLPPMLAPAHVGEHVMPYTDKVTTAWASPQNMMDALAVAPLTRGREAMAATRSLWSAWLEFLATGGGSATFDLNDAWPIDAIKLRIPRTLLAHLTQEQGWVSWDQLPISGEDQDQAEATFARWARGVTARRVGVALGGGGALSYVAVPLLRGLAAAGIPIDVATGCSFGAIVSAYYATHGPAGLDRIVKHWYAAQATVAWGFITSVPFQFWIDVDLAFVQIQDLEINFVPVATDARSGLEWPIRAGVVGQACSASGAVPPLAPTYDGTRRLLDGAIAAEVPAAIAVFSGSNMVIGCNVIPLPEDTGPEPALAPHGLWTAVRSLNPMRRLYDYSRAYEMLYRQCSASQAEWANVTFVATTQHTSAGDFWKCREIIDDAQTSRNMAFAIDQARQAWLQLQLHTAERVRFRCTADGILLVGDATIAGPERGDIGFVDDDTLLPASEAFLARVAHFLSDATWARVVIHLWQEGEQDGLPSAVAVARRDAILAALRRADPLAGRLGDCIHYGPGLVEAENHVDLQLHVDAPAPPCAVLTRHGEPA